MPVTGLVSRVRFPFSTQTCGFKLIWSQHLVKKLYPPDWCRRTGGRLSTTLAAKACMLSTQQERSLKWIDPGKWWWREDRWTSRESLWLPANRHQEARMHYTHAWRYPIWAYKWLGTYVWLNIPIMSWGLKDLFL